MPLVNSLINGEVSKVLNIEDRAIHYADGVFETMLMTKGKIALWPEHFARLSLGCEKLFLTLESENNLLNDISTLTENLHHSTLVIKLIVSRGAAGRGNVIDHSVPSTVILLAYDYQKNKSDKGKVLSLCQTPLLINEMLGGVKHLNRLVYVLAAKELTDNQDEGLLLNDKNEIIEGTTHNVFFVSNDDLITPPITNCGVAGIMRQKVIDVANSLNLKVKIQPVNVKDLDSMDECFISNAVVGIQAVAQIDDKKFIKNAMTLKLKIKIDGMLNV